MQQARCLILQPQDGEKRMRRWGYPFLIKIDQHNGGASQFVVGSEKIPPGKLVHPHKHCDCEELITLNSGSGILTLGDERVAIRPGALVFIPMGTWHGLENTGDEDIDFSWIFPKPGIDQYFRATSVSATESNRAIGGDELAEIRRSYRQEVVYKDALLDNYVET